MDKLISNTDFGFYVRKLEVNDYKKLELRENYDLFLKHPLTLSMFIPCDLDGNVLEEPKKYQPIGSFSSEELLNDIEECFEADTKEYKLAQERIYFKGFGEDSEFNIVVAIKKGFGFNINDISKLTIEDLTKYNLVLTETAKKQIGL